MRGFQRLASAARGTLWLLRATGLRDHFSKFESHLNDLDAKVLHVASQSATAIRMADNVQRLDKQISDVMADVTAQHATTMRVAESVQRLGKHIVDVAANNLTNGRLSEQFQKLEKHLTEIGASHPANGKLDAKLIDKLREPFQELQKQVAQLAASSLAAHRELGERMQRLEKQLESAVPLSKLMERLQTLEQCLKEIHVKIEQATAGLVKLGSDKRRQSEQLQAQDLRVYE